MDPHSLEIPTEFSSRRLSFRRYCPGDGAMYFQMLRENWDHLYEFLPASLSAVQSEQDVEADLQWRITEWDLRNLFIFGVWEKETGAYVG
jgi:hypothetical protein